MKHFIFLAIITFLFFDYVSGQDNKKDSSPYLLLGTGIEQVFWPDTVMANHVLNYPGKTYISDERTKDGKIYRNVFFPDGTPKIKAEIKSGIIRIDTVSMPRSTPPYEWYDTIIYVKGDLCNGTYIEYFPGTLSGSNPELQYKGQYNDGNKVGKWTEYVKDGGKIIANYDKQGNLNGKYTEYYENDTIKWKGQYGLKKMGTWKHVINNQTQKIIPVKADVIESVRIGQWQLYNKRGELVQTVYYNWPVKK